ncbi:MAG: ATP-dependent Clp protease proteolytic subunit [Clostridiales bacterium]|uniref:ClpP family protease n=1 Tax=Terrisporobacter sp. TaxID=1965305 RepID=UPI002A5370CD|nr:ATP-dependent Clp protease proteolytic subunit [Terrisporobacter sp.]MDD7755724.1 ATP-dependent Clp protease proteolytic subunit [Clostridiales bacterium]MDY4137177.1 ATP-dependent Clp protease proteolytic subunit [Terrisporobacter sp.]
MDRLVKDFQLFARDQGVSSNTFHGYFNPYIIEERKLNVASMDVFSRLMMDRIIFVGTQIDDDVANVIQAQLLYLQSLDDKADISLYLNTPGGIVSAGLGIYDTMQLIRPNVNTICTGLAASMGSILLVAGKERSILPHAKVMIHQPLGGAMGQASDILIEAEEIRKCRDELCNILSEHTKQPFDKIFQDMDRNHWFTAQEAVDYGLVDKILNK